jgi:hypothetical protein
MKRRKKQKNEAKNTYWIKSGVIIKEKERQATSFGKGTSEENGDDMMERADDTNKKRRQMIIDNEEAVQAHKQKIHRQGYRNYTNTDQSGNVRYINVRYKGRPDLQVPIDNSSTTSGVFAAKTRIDPSSIHTLKDHYTRIKDA